MALEGSMKSGTSDFSGYYGSRLSEEASTLARRWLEKLEEMTPLRPGEIFPSRELLDHIPQLLADIGEDIKNQGSGIVSSNSMIIDKAQQLGELRFSQRASIHQLLNEYASLAEVLDGFLRAEIESSGAAPSAGSLLSVMDSTNRNIRAIMQTTVDTFVEKYVERIAEQQDRLASFNSMVSHELRNPINTIQMNAEVLGLRMGHDSAHAGPVTSIQDQTKRLADLLQSLEQTTQAAGQASADPLKQTLRSEDLALEIIDQWRTEANSIGVDLRVGRHLPIITTNPGQLSVVLSNLISNGIKYSDPNKAERFVEIAGGTDTRNMELTVIIVRDNGIGMPADASNAVFEKFTRLNADKQHPEYTEGYGIGLHLVRECIDKLAGTIELHSVPGQGTTFEIRLPQPARDPAYQSHAPA